MAKERFRRHGLLFAAVVLASSAAAIVQVAAADGKAFPSITPVEGPPEIVPLGPTGTVSDIAVAQRAKASDVTIYGGQFAQVQESRTVRLQAGKNRVQLLGIAQQYRASSLRLVGTAGPGNLTYKSAVYQPANLDTERLLQEAVGRNIVAYRSGANANMDPVIGKLIASQGGQLVIMNDVGGVEIVTANNVNLGNGGTSLSNTASLIVEVDATTAGDYTLDFLYETGGLGWSAQHSVIFDEKTSTIKGWETSVTIANESGTTFDNATVRLIAGRGGAGPTPAMYRSKGAEESAMMAAAAPAGDAASVESVGEEKVYNLPGTTRIGEGQTVQVPLLSATDVPVKLTYVATPQSYYDGAARGAMPAQVRLTVDNCVRDHMGKALPPGAVKVYQSTAGGKLALTGSTRITDKAVDEKFNMTIGTSTDIKFEQKLVDAKPVGPQPMALPGQSRDPVYEDQTFSVTIYNFKKDRDVEVKVELAVPAQQQLQPRWNRPSAERADTIVKIGPTDSAKVEYTVRQQVYR